MANSLEMPLNTSQPITFLGEAHGDITLAIKNLQSLQSIILKHQGKPCVLGIEMAFNSLTDKDYFDVNGELKLDAIIQNYTKNLHNSIMRTMRVFPKQNIEKVIQITSEGLKFTKVQSEQLQYSAFKAIMVNLVQLNIYRELQRLKDKYPNFTIMSLEHNINKKIDIPSPEVILNTSRSRNTPEGFTFMQAREKHIYENYKNNNIKIIWSGLLHIIDFCADGSLHGVAMECLLNNNFNIQFESYDSKTTDQFYIDKQLEVYQSFKRDIEAFDTEERNISGTILNFMDIAFQKSTMPLFAERKKIFESAYFKHLIESQKAQPTQAINPDTNQVFANVAEAEKYLATRNSGRPLHDLQVSSLKQIIKFRTTTTGEFDNSAHGMSSPVSKTPAIQNFFANSEKKSPIANQLAQESWNYAFEKIPNFEEIVGLKSLKLETRNIIAKDIMDVAQKLPGSLKTNMQTISEVIDNFIKEEFTIGNSKKIKDFSQTIHASDHEKQEIIKKLQKIEINIQSIINPQKSIVS